MRYSGGATAPSGHQVNVCSAFTMTVGLVVADHDQAPDGRFACEPVRQGLQH